MYPSKLSGEADLLFETDFELYVKKLLEDRGYRVFHSVYLKGSKYESQIDLVAVKDYMVLGIECKSQLGKSWYCRRNGDWEYIDLRGNLQKVKNPYRQNKNHQDALYTLCLSIERSLYEKYNILCPFCRSIIVDKASHSKDQTYDISACHYLKLDDLLDKFNFSRGKEIDNYMHSLIYPILEKASDSSKDRLKAHIEYIQKEVLS